MKEEILEIFGDLADYMNKGFNGVKPFIATLWAVISYVLFPDKAYIPAALGVGGAMVLDIITKYYSLSKPYGSVILAIKAGAIKSENFYRGTKRKLISFLVVMILCGLSVRVSPIAGVAVFLSTLAYSVMFLRECQSCIENLIDAGHSDLNWLLPVLKKREKDILSKEGVTDESCYNVTQGNKTDKVCVTPVSTEKSTKKGDDTNATI